jgi:hypothetical protein
MYYERAAVSAIRYELPKLSAENYITFRPDGLWTPIIDADNIVYNSLFKPFNINQYLYPRPPIDMGLVPSIHGTPPNVLRMPLKFPGTNYIVPRELEALVPIIRRAAEYESFLCKEWSIDPDSTFCHITYDSSDLDTGVYHSLFGIHRITSRIILLRILLVLLL